MSDLVKNLFLHLNLQFSTFHNLWCPFEKDGEQSVANPAIPVQPTRSANLSLLSSPTHFSLGHLAKGFTFHKTVLRGHGWVPLISLNCAWSPCELENHLLSGSMACAPCFWHLIGCSCILLDCAQLSTWSRLLYKRAFAPVPVTVSQLNVGCIFDHN